MLEDVTMDPKDLVDMLEGATMAEDNQEVKARADTLEVDLEVIRDLEEGPEDSLEQDLVDSQGLEEWARAAWMPSRSCLT
jgi:hypothetical protein